MQFFVFLDFLKMEIMEMGVKIFFIALLKIKWFDIIPYAPRITCCLEAIENEIFADSIIFMK